jgi:hypothetical protein
MSLFSPFYMSHRIRPSPLFDKPVNQGQAAGVKGAIPATRPPMPVDLTDLPFVLRSQCNRSRQDRMAKYPTFATAVGTEVTYSQWGAACASVTARRCGAAPGAAHGAGPLRRIWPGGSAWASRKKPAAANTGNRTANPR